MRLGRLPLADLVDARAGSWHPRAMPRANLVSAALRHVRDAEHLLEQGPHRSLEQVLHLVGFGPECVRKACIDEELADKALGHEIRGASDPIVDVLVAIDPSASRYRIDDQESELPLRMAHWTMNARYMMSGQGAEATAESLTKEARRFVDRCVEILWSDGVLDAEALK
jgi:hypothetical protein